MRTHRRCQCDEIVDRCHLTIAQPHIDVVERLPCDTVGGLCLHRDVIKAGEAVEIGDVGTAIVTGYRREDITRRYSCPLTFGSIDVEPELRITGGEVGEGLADLRLTGELIDKGIFHALKLCR